MPSFCFNFLGKKSEKHHLYKASKSMIGPTGSRNSSTPSDVAKMKPRLPWMIWRNLSRPASCFDTSCGFFFPFGMLTEIPCFG